LARTTNRTNTLLSIARMAFANVFSNRVLHIRRGPFPLFRKEHVLNILGAKPPHPTDEHSAVVPFQYGTWPNAD
jgi:hypothetical protein